MTSQWVDVIQAATGLLAVVIAALAVFITIRSENRAAERFSVETRLQEKVAKANLKPLLAVFTAEFADNKGILLLNAGIGTAVITHIDFAKGDKRSRALWHLFEMPEDMQWDNAWYFRPRKHYLAAGKSIDLVRLTADNLQRQGFSESEIDAILDTWQEQMPGITIEIRYEDVLGNAQEDYKLTLE